MTCGGGFETWLQYVDGFELRHFCAFELINDDRGLSCLTDYHRKLVEARYRRFRRIGVVSSR